MKKLSDQVLLKGIWKPWNYHLWTWKFDSGDVLEISSVARFMLECCFSKVNAKIKCSLCWLKLILLLSYYVCEHFAVIPQLIAQLKAEVQKLKDELAMASGQEYTGELTEDEMDRY